MKKSLPFFLMFNLMFSLILCDNANSGSGEVETCMSSLQHPTCDGGTTTPYMVVGICDTGTTLISDRCIPNANQTSMKGGQYCYTCRPCNGCSTDCAANTTAWGLTGTAGYETRTAGYCYCESCRSRVEYRCTTLYYGTSTDGKTGCKSCRIETGNDDAMSSPGTTEKTGCYLPPRTNPYNDDTGSFQYTQNCNWSD
jgi:hypothetical protein